jgi:hypothetical protein
MHDRYDLTSSAASDSFLSVTTADRPDPTFGPHVPSPNPTPREPFERPASPQRASARGALTTARTLTNGITLSPGDNPVSITATGRITTAAGDAVYGYTTEAVLWTVSNSGMLVDHDGTSAAVRLKTRTTVSTTLSPTSPAAWSRRLITSSSSTVPAWSSIRRTPRSLRQTPDSHRRSTSPERVR